MAAEHDLVLVVDFGAHYAQLISDRVRRARIYSEIVPHTVPSADLLAREPKAIILSGGPQSVYSAGAPQLDPKIFDGDVPVFGICYGFQVIAVALGGEVSRTGASEFGRTVLTITEPGTLLTAIPADQRVWMSHGDAVAAAPEGMTALASTDGAPVAAFESLQRRIAGVQWHPEVLHTEYGQQVLERFLIQIAGVRQTWTPRDVVEEQTGLTSEQVRDIHAICLFPGGVDAALATVLVEHTIGGQLPGDHDDGVRPRTSPSRRFTRGCRVIRAGRAIQERRPEPKSPVRRPRPPRPSPQDWWQDRWSPGALSRRKESLAVAVVVLLLATAGLLGSISNDNHGWVDGQRYGAWLAVYNGYGRTTAYVDDGVETIILEPEVATTPDVTHASLVVSAQKFADVEVNAIVTTERQLRANPNPWEVGWVLWRYSDPDHFYSVALKPNGWEISKQDPAYPGKQRFLATGMSPEFPVGSTYHVRIVERDNSIQVLVDGKPLTQFTDDERPYLQGSVGLYTEDARVVFQNVQAVSPQ